ncbi:MAG TPA: hypothetical protein VI814_07205 [Candidatus Limnocylindria bacterium]
MKRFLVPLLAFPIIALVACNQAANNNASSSPYASGSAAASARATGSVAASAQASASASGSTKYITLDVPVPQSGMNAGVDGKGWTVDIVAKGNGPAMDKVKPAFQTTSTTATGRNTNFPGLVVIVKESSGSSGSSPNLAKLFQMIGLPNTLQGAGISSVGTSASGSPAASASANASASSSAAPSAAGSAATSSKAVDQGTAEATWFVQQSMWGSDADVELDAFVVDGDAPDSISSDTSNLKIVSNIVTVHFHINGGGKGSSPSGSASPSTSASPSGSSAPGSASPSPSASSTP